MNGPLVRIRFDGNGRVYRPGETLVGRVPHRVGRARRDQGGRSLRPLVHRGEGGRGPGGPRFLADLGRQRRHARFAPPGPVQHGPPAKPAELPRGPGADPLVRAGAGLLDPRPGGDGGAGVPAGRRARGPDAGRGGAGGEQRAPSKRPPKRPLWCDPRQRFQRRQSLFDALHPPRRDPLSFSAGKQRRRAGRAVAIPGLARRDRRPARQRQVVAGGGARAGHPPRRQRSRCSSNCTTASAASPWTWKREDKGVGSLCLPGGSGRRGHRPNKDSRPLFRRDRRRLRAAFVVEPAPASSRRAAPRAGAGGDFSCADRASAVVPHGHEPRPGPGRLSSRSWPAARNSPAPNWSVPSNSPGGSSCARGDMREFLFDLYDLYEERRS